MPNKYLVKCDTCNDGILGEYDPAMEKFSWDHRECSGLSVKQPGKRAQVIEITTRHNISGNAQVGE